MATPDGGDSPPWKRARTTSDGDDGSSSASASVSATSFVRSSPSGPNHTNLSQDADRSASAAHLSASSAAAASSSASESAGRWRDDRVDAVGDIRTWGSAVFGVAAVDTAAAGAVFTAAGADAVASPLPNGAATVVVGGKGCALACA